MIDKKFVINFTQLLKHGSDGSYQQLLFKPMLEDENENVFVFDGFKILKLDDRYIYTKVFVQQFTKEGSDLGFYAFEYKFSVANTVKIANQKAIAKNHLELAFVDLFIKLYDKKIMAKNFNRNNFVVNEKIDELALVIVPMKTEDLLLNKKEENDELKGDENDTQ